MRPLTIAAALLAAVLNSCAAPPQEADEKYPDELYAADARAAADAIWAGMERARRDLARRAIMRMFRERGEDPD